MPAEQVPRNLAVDNEILVPVDKVVHVLVTSTDVIHAWTIPSFGSKVDAVPGRITATWFKATKEGIYFGQCSELCGKDHAFMPIAVRVVKEQVFNDWAAAVKAQGQEEGAGDHPQRGARAGGVGRRPRDAGRCDSCGPHSRGQLASRMTRAAQNGCEGRRHGDQGSRGTRVTRPRAHALRLRAVAQFDEPQGHRHDVPAVRHHGRADRRLPVGGDAHGAAGAGPAVFRQRPHVQRVRHRPRPHHGVLHGDAGHDRRLRQLVRAAA